MQLVCVAEVTADHEIKIDDAVKSKLHPGEKIKLKIEPLDKENRQRKAEAISWLKETSMKSRLGLYKNVTREDAHDRDII